jgi:hypothetical protein
MSTGEGQALGPLPGPPVSLTDQTVAAIRAAVRDGTLRSGKR